MRDVYVLYIYFQIYTSSVEFRNVLRRLNECLKDENIEALRRIRENNLDEDQVVVGMGLHLIQKLIGNCITNRKKVKSFAHVDAMKKYHTPTKCG